MFLKQSTATTVIVGPFIDDTDGKTPETGLTVTSIDVDIYKGITKTDLTITASGGNNDMAHVANGYYSLELTSGNTDTVGRFRVTANISGALPVWVTFIVLSAQVYDSLVAGSDALQVHANEISNNLITAAAIDDNAIDAGALATSAIDEIVDAVWDELQADHADLSPMTMGGSLSDAAATIDPWDAQIGVYTTAGSAGKALADAASGGGGSSPAAIADAVWDEAAADHVAAGSAGLALAYARDGSSVNGSTTAANNLKKWFNGEAYANANAGIGTAGAVTGTVNANMVNLGGSSVNFDKWLALVLGAVRGTVTAGTNTTTVVTSSGLSAVNGFYVGKTFVAISGANAGQGGKLVVGYDGATKQLTIEALTSAMSVNDTFVLVG